MRIVYQLVVILSVLIAFGAAKLSFENELHGDMVEAQLLQPSLKQGTHLKLGQTSAAVAMGGLRSLVAAILNLRAFSHFENVDWIKLEESYEVITTLQPQTTQYWETGAWHLHTNASVYYSEKKDLSPLRRDAMRDQYIKKGSSFLEEGVRQNPDDWRLHLSLARLWSDRYKKPDFERSMKHYGDAIATESMPDYMRKLYSRFRFYSMARIPKRHPEALQEGVRLYKLTEDHHLPNLINIIFALQNAQATPEAERIPETQLYPNEKTQLIQLTNYWNNRDIGFPVDGVKEKIQQLEEKLGAVQPKR